MSSYNFRNYKSKLRSRTICRIVYLISQPVKIFFDSRNAQFGHLLFWKIFGECRYFIFFIDNIFSKIQMNFVCSLKPFGRNKQNEKMSVRSLLRNFATHLFRDDLRKIKFFLGNESILIIEIYTCHVKNIAKDK